MYKFLILLICLSGCTTHPEQDTAWQEIRGRNSPDSSIRPKTYRAKAPNTWIRHDPPLSESIHDSTKSLCEFFIKENERQIRITVHNFPTQTLEERIAPASQIARWKRQFERLDPSSIYITPEAHGGFTGFFFEGSGFINNQESAMLGLSMQLAPEHFRNLSIKDSNASRQMRADYTIKAIGPKDLISKHKQAIIAFALSFELIEEIPARP